MFHLINSCNKQKQKISLILNMSHVHNVFLTETKTKNVQEAVDTDDDDTIIKIMIIMFYDSNTLKNRQPVGRTDLKTFWLVSSIT